MSDLHNDSLAIAPGSTASQSRRLSWAALLVAVFAVVPYLNALTADFTFDDIGVVRDNPAVQVRPAVELLSYVYQPGALYRPLTMLTYAASAGAGPATYHAVNVALHVLVSVAVFWLALRVLGALLPATIAALLFAVHPIHTEAVTGIVGRAELLAALGVLVALLAFARSLESAARRAWVWSAISVVAFAAALLAKESALTGLGLLVILHWWLERDARLTQRLAALAPYGVIAAAYVALHVAVVGALGLPDPPTLLDNPLAWVDVGARIRTAVIVLWDYIALLTAPLNLSADYSFNQIPVALAWNDQRFLLAAALLFTLAVVVMAWARTAPALVVAALFFVIPLALTANIVFPIGTVKGERLLYLPSIGWCLAGGWLAAHALRRRQAVAAVGLAVGLAVYGTRTWIRNGDWHDEPTLFTVTLIDAPNSAKAHYNGGVALQRAGRLNEAMAHYRRALAIYPDYPAAAFGIGHIYSLKGMDGGALHWYEEALRLDPTFAKAHLQIALLRQGRGEYDAAEAALRAGLDSEPNNRMLLVNLSAVQLVQGDRWRAGAALVRLARLGTLDAEEHEVVEAARREIEVALR